MRGSLIPRLMVSQPNRLCVLTDTQFWVQRFAGKDALDQFAAIAASMAGPQDKQPAGRAWLSGRRIRPFDD
jgi:hypothetical protein